MSVFGIPDKALVAAHLSDLRQLSDVEREGYDALAERGEKVMRYEGEVSLPCKDCERFVSVGPRGQLALSLGAELACMSCAAISASVAQSYSVDTLGNDGGTPR